jgi:hypothetical protein
MCFKLLTFNPSPFKSPYHSYYSIFGDLKCNGYIHNRGHIFFSHQNERNIPLHFGDHSGTKRFTINVYPIGWDDLRSIAYFIMFYYEKTFAPKRASIMLDNK